MRKEILFCDPRCFRPAAHRATWKARPEPMAAGGVVLDARVGKKSKELRLNPRLKGWYRISVGLYNPGRLVTGLNLRLSNDPHFDFIQCSNPDESGEELTFKSADMTGRELVIGQPDDYPLSLDYVKFTPARPEPAGKPRWKVGAINDFFSFTYDQLMRHGVTDLERCVWLHQRAGFNVMYWLAAGGSCFYRTKIGTECVPDSRARTQSYFRFMRKHDVLGLACEACHKAGMEFYPWFRINNEYGWAVKELGKDVVSDFWRKHPQFRDVERSGKRSDGSLSFAYPEVVAYKVALAREMMQYGGEGIFIDTQRHPPMTQYAPPAVSSFRKIYGADPFKIPEDDERWLRHKSTFFTEFMRRLRSELSAQDPVLKIAIRTSLHPFRCLKEGVDVEALVKEGLVDVLIPSSHVYFSRFSLKPFLPMLKGRRCAVYGGISPYIPGGSDPGTLGAPVWPMRKPIYASGADFASQSEQFRIEGVDGVVLYESEAIITRPGIKQAVQRMAGRPS